LNVAKRQEASLKYFLGSELQKARIMSKIWAKYKAAGHATFGATKGSILPKNDAGWVKDKRTYLIKYSVDPELGVMKDVVIEITLAIKDSRKVVVGVLNDNFKKTPKMTNQVALGKLAKWAAKKITEPQYVKSKGKTYVYPASKRGAAIAWRVANKIQKDRKIMNKSGFIKPFTDRRQNLVYKAVNKAVDRFVNGRWQLDINTSIYNVIQYI
jgi:hypothetical protein